MSADAFRAELEVRLVEAGVLTIMTRDEVEGFVAALLPIIDQHIEQRVVDMRGALARADRVHREALAEWAKDRAERDRLQAQLDAIRPRAQAIYDRWQYDDADIDARAILHIIDGPTPPAGTETTDG